jgi:hypothetical protein
MTKVPPFKYGTRNVLDYAAKDSHLSADKGGGFDEEASVMEGGIRCGREIW